MKLRAMVLDDSRIMRRIVMESVRKTEVADFEFVEAENGAVGLSKFDPKLIDVVFVDWNMPNMNGLDFIRNVRAMNKSEHVIIIMVTSEKIERKVNLALSDAGADAYIAKPFKVNDLQYKLNNLIDKKIKNKKKLGFFNRIKG